MSVKGHKVTIRRSELHTVEDTLPLWEVAVVAAVHDEGALKIVGNVVIQGRDLPDPREEYERLEARYKRSRNDDGSFGPPVVATVYGQHGAGLLALKAAINEAAVEAESLV